MYVRFRLLDEKEKEKRTERKEETTEGNKEKESLSSQEAHTRHQSAKSNFSLKSCVQPSTPSNQFSGKDNLMTSLATKSNSGEGTPSTDVIADLLVEHAVEVQRLTDSVAASLPADKTDGIYAKYDDLFFLRYILSFGTADKSKDAVLACLKFRSEPRWQQLIRQVKEDTYEDNDFVKEMKKWQVAAPLEGVTVSGGFCVVIRGGLSDQCSMIDRIPKHDMYTANMVRRQPWAPLFLLLSYSCVGWTLTLGSFHSLSIHFPFTDINTGVPRNCVPKM